jgi:hypothetical protein
VQYGYPFLESIRSLLPVVDELVVNVGVGSDSTLAEIQALARSEPKIRIIESVWDESLRKGGKILAQQTDIAMKACKGKWGIYLQADEVLHEDDYEKIKTAIAKADKETDVDGLLFAYIHFYGDFSVINRNPSAYRREIRAVRLDSNRQIFSYRDAQGFRKRRDGRDDKLGVIHSGARIFHYGWVRPQEVMKKKTVAMDALYHEGTQGTGDNSIYKRIFGLEYFRGTHPEVMSERIHGSRSWAVDLFQSPMVFTWKDIRKVIAYGIEKITGQLPFEYKNYKRID